MTTTLAKQIQLYVPPDAELPTTLYELTPEQTHLVLSIGCQILESAKTGLTEQTHTEIAQQIEKKYAGKTQELADLHWQLEQKEKENQTTVENLTQMMRRVFMTERDTLQDRVNFLENEIVRLRAGQSEEYKAVFEKTVDKITALHNATTTTTTTTTKSSVSLGKIGETKFAELAHTVFRDYESFELVDVHSFAGYGDYHLRFKEFTVLADSKQYSGKVNATSRDKIKRDLQQNDVDFAWLISMDTTIDKYDKYEFMFEWVSDRKCVCYVNALMKRENPGEILRTIWYCCKLLYDHVIKVENRDNAVDKYREFQMKVKDLGERMKRNVRERETIMTQLRANFDRNDEVIRELVTDETNQLTSHFAMIREWWSANVESAPNDQSIKSTNLWLKFKKDHSEQKDMNMNAALFKEAICAMLPENQLIKSKTKGGPLNVLNVRWKTKSQSDSESGTDTIEIDTSISSIVVI
jgi:hypothetical protein